MWARTLWATTQLRHDSAKAAADSEYGCVPNTMMETSTKPDLTHKR